jgi:hypothetical protein
MSAAKFTELAEAVQSTIDGQQRAIALLESLRGFQSPDALFNALTDLHDTDVRRGFLRVIQKRLEHAL